MGLIENRFDRYRKYAPILVRLGIGSVFLLLGIDQLMNPEAWVAWMPSWISWTTPEQFFFMNGIFNSIIGFSLIIGFLTRIAALFAVLHLVGVLASLGYNDIAIRDFGLLLAALSVFLRGRDSWCIH